MTPRIFFDAYPFLKDYTSPVKKAERDIVGRDKEILQILAAFKRPELCNIILLGEAGCGKTALVQGTMLKDPERIYLEVDLSKMIANLSDPNEMAAKLKALFAEVSQYSKDNSVELVLFMDEFHQIVQLSDAAVEALKPLLADSGTRGIRIIAATTYEEFRTHISPNQPLVERLQRISLKQPDEALTVSILKGMAKRYGVDHYFYDDSVFKLIYEYTNRYVPANSQPRKSILVLDSMVGWHRLNGRKMDAKLLADVIEEQENVNVAFSVDAKTIKQELDKYVLSQTAASSAIEERLQICVADLNDKRRPMSTFLFTGSTGIGKAIASYEVLPVMRNGVFLYLKAGEVKEGDYLFDELGEPQQVGGVFPQGKRPVWRVEFASWQYHVDCDHQHLWAWLPSRSAYEAYRDWNVTTLHYLNKLREIPYNVVVPFGHTLQTPNVLLPVHPYVLGASIAAQVAHETHYVLQSENITLIEYMSNCLGASGFALCSDIENGYVFYKKSTTNDDHLILTPQDVLGEYASYSLDTIPMRYLTSGTAQRTDLFQGLMDAGASVYPYEHGRDYFSAVYASENNTLIASIKTLASGLGIQVRVNDDFNAVPSGHLNYLYFKCDERTLPLLFRWHSDRKLCEIYMRSLNSNFDTVSMDNSYALQSIKKGGVEFVESDMVCFYINSPSHLFQTQHGIVTHNTEMTKQLARILFDDDRNLLRFDMTEYANPDSLERFRDSLTTRVWERPYSIILLDEIEKACAPVTRLLLQVLDDGRLSDRNGRETSFINAYIVLTTNAGSEIYKTIAQYNPDDEGSGELMKNYDALIRRSLSETTGDNRFPPELLGRIDAIVPFQPLSRNTQKNIVAMKLHKLKDEIQKKHGATLQITRRVIDYIVEDNMSTDSDAGGARRIMSKIESELTTAVARYINEHPGLSSITVKIDGSLVSEDKSKLKSDAKIVVGGRM